MRDHQDLLLWLGEQSPSNPLAIDGESVYLRLADGGAELGVHLWPGATVAQLQDALKHGFASAIEYDAGLGLAPDGQGVVLSQWLPAVHGWDEAAVALEQLLNQVASWRAQLGPVVQAAARVPAGISAAARQEQKMRRLLAGGR